MIDYLLKSAGCLLVFYVFYILFLEKENMHVYKRIYLLVTISVSFIIPFITFTSYVEMVEQITPMIFTQGDIEIPVIDEVDSIAYTPIVLWSIYGLGVLLFSIKFIKNITEILLKIKNNIKEEKGSTTAILLEESTVPHTFFNFIFLNRSKYRANQIPYEVLLHEQAHAHQKHSIDVLFIEFVQLLFWFNPIIYLLKRAIKLNHEFLADQAVLQHGANSKTYQETLLAFSSNASQLPLANAINYSSIKKRLTLMKTHTSKKTIWIRSFILIPVLALLLFSFSTTVQQEKATPQQVAEYNTLAKKYNSQPKSSRIIKFKDLNRLEYLYKLMTPSQKKSAETFPECPPPPPPAPPKMPKNANYILDNKKVSYEEASKVSNDKIQSVDVVTKDENGNKLDKSTIFIYTKKEKKKVDESKRPITLINGKSSCDGCVLELTKEKFAAIVLSVEKEKVVSFLIKFPKRPTLKIKNSTTLNKQAKTFLHEAEIGQMVQVFNLKSSESDLSSAPVIFKIVK